MSSSQLVVVTIGPVQGFIAAARRTRDFWMGSTILSEAAKAIALDVVKTAGAASLIFPAPTTESDLQPIEFDKAGSEVVSKLDVANIVLFTLDANHDVRTLVGKLHENVRGRWMALAENAAKKCQSDLRDEWRCQLGECPIEFYAAWVPFLETDYGGARQRVMRLLAGRKACRDFTPWLGTAGVPKSSLDGARETVLVKIDPKRPRRRRGLHARPQEELDLLGVVKRVDWGKDGIRYPSVSRVAADPWIRGVVKSGSAVEAVWNRATEECSSLGFRKRKEQNRRGTEDDIPKFPWLKPFPFEGSPLFVSRHDELIDELLEDVGFNEGDEEDWSKARNEMRSELKDLIHALSQLRSAHGLGEPLPYLAILAADGDGIGKTLSSLAAQSNGADLHRDFSRRQAQFAGEVRTLINQTSGICVYAGADDVLGFVATDSCIDCALQIRSLFERLVGKFVASLDLPKLSPPTISIGVAIGHFMDPLEDLLDYARAAEHRAKNPILAESTRGQVPRNALAVAVHPRSGASFTVRDNWIRADRPDVLGVADRLSDWARIHAARSLPAAAAYDLRQAALVNVTSEAEAVRLDALRILTRKRGASATEVAKARVRALLANVSNAAELQALAEELIVGQWLGDALSQASGRPPRPAGKERRA